LATNNVAWTGLSSNATPHGRKLATNRRTNSKNKLNS